MLVYAERRMERIRRYEFSLHKKEAYPMKDKLLFLQYEKWGIVLGQDINLP